MRWYLNILIKSIYNINVPNYYLVSYKHNYYEYKFSRVPKSYSKRKTCHSSSGMGARIIFLTAWDAVPRRANWHRQQQSHPVPMPSHPTLSESMTHTQLLILQEPFIDTALHGYTHTVFTVPLLFTYTNVHCDTTAYCIPYRNMLFRLVTQKQQTTACSLSVQVHNTYIYIGTV